MPVLIDVNYSCRPAEVIVADQVLWRMVGVVGFERSMRFGPIKAHS